MIRTLQFVMRCLAPFDIYENIESANGFTL